MVHTRAGALTVLPTWVLAVFGPLSVRWWTMVAWPAVWLRLSLCQCAGSQSQKCCDSDGKSQTLELHDAPFLQKRQQPQGLLRAPSCEWKQEDDAAKTRLYRTLRSPEQALQALYRCKNLHHCGFWRSAPKPP